MTTPQTLILYSVCLLCTSIGVVSTYKFYVYTEKSLVGFKKKLVLPLLTVVLFILVYLLVFVTAFAVYFLHQPTLGVV